MKNRKKAILIALCIGDGYLNKDKQSKSVSLHIKHSSKQEALIIYKRDLLFSLIGGAKPNLRYFNNNGYPGISFSKGMKYFRIIKKWLYPNNKKLISRFLLDKLTPEAIAIWYMDDGSLSAKKRNGKIHAYEMTLNTYESKEDNQIIIDYFKEVWDIQWHQAKGKGQYRLRMSTKEIRRFIPLIKPFIIPSMQYKIEIKTSHKSGNL